MKHLLFALLLLTAAPVLAQGAGSSLVEKGSKPEPKDDFLEKLDIYSKVFGASITALGVFFGLPLAVANFRKTKAEIKKIELEAKVLEGKVGGTTASQSGHIISIEGSNDVSVQILADPRFLGPLLLLLDFIIAWIVLSMLSYFLDLFDIPFSSAITLIVSGFILVPILKESWRVKKVLSADKDSSIK